MHDYHVTFGRGVNNIAVKISSNYKIIQYKSTKCTFSKFNSLILNFNFINIEKVHFVALCIITFQCTVQKRKKNRQTYHISIWRLLFGTTVVVELKCCT